MVTNNKLIRTISILSVLVILLGLLLTGWRLYLFSNSYSGFMAPIIDSVSLSGQAHIFHYRLGVALVALLGFMIVYYFLSGWEGLVGTKKHSTKIYLWAGSILLLLLTISSGFALYHGWHVPTVFQDQLGLIHLLSSSLLLPITLFFIAVMIKERKLTEEITDSRRNGGRIGIIFLIALSAGAIYSWAATMGGEPVTLVSKFTSRFINIDGRISNNEWFGAARVRIPVLGANSRNDDKVSELVIRSLHSSRRIYFLIRWRDQTKSHNRQLLKTENGWEERVSAISDLFGEREYFEDMLAISFDRQARGCVSSCHLTGSARPVQSAGIHYTDGDTVDLWKWQAVSSDPAKQAEDGFWMGYLDDDNGGRRNDNETKNGSYTNLNIEWQQPYFFPLNPYNKSWIWVGTGIADPYLLEADTFAVGSVIPSVLVDRLIGDRGDVRARGFWQGGLWTVELSRSLRTGSPHDVEFRDTLYMGVALFDNAEKKHAYHMKPIRLVIE